MKRTLSIISLILVVSIGLYLTRSESFPSKFEVTDLSSHIKATNKQDFSGATMVNLDEDEAQEIFVSGHGSSNVMLKRVNNDFQPISIPELADSEGLTFSVTACDLDQDGRDEILLLNRRGEGNRKSVSRIVKYVKGKWEDLLTTNTLITSSMEASFSATCIDRKGDGKYGLAITHQDGKISYLEMRGTEIADVAGEIGLSLQSKGRSILGVPGPLGSINILVGNEEGNNFYFVNNGDGTYTEKAVDYGIADPSFNARGITLIDANHDDLADVIYGNHLGPIRLMQQKRDGKFEDVTPEVMTSSYAVNSVVVGDFNLDGYEDLYLNNIFGKNTVFGRYKDKWFELDIPKLEEKEMFGISTIAGDLDNNGSYEILNTHGNGGVFPLTLYTIKPEKRWVKLTVNYKNGGIPRGAIVRLRTNKREMLRTISTGSGRYANYDEAVLYGLLDKEEALSVEIILPSGRRIEIPKPLVQSNNVISI